MNQLPTLAMVVPCFNEAQVITTTAQRLHTVIQSLIHQNKISSQSFIYFVDDGSNDQTWSLIEELHQNDPIFKGLKLSRNFGHQNALLAGLISVKNYIDCAISIDSDLQQDETAIPLFIEKFTHGAEVVFGVRNDRNTDSVLKKNTALFFYNLMSYMGIKIIKNHADYRLVSKKVIGVLEEYQEVNLFLRGIFTDLGFKTDIVYFDVRERYAGESKYSFKKMLKFALDGITAFSITPLRIISILGFIIFILSLASSVFVLFSKIFNGRAVLGWASTVLPIYLIGGFQVMCLGIVGEYVGRIYKEVKARPRFIKDTELFN